MKFDILQYLSRSIVQLPGWHTTRKLVVIESDDWGCKRTLDKQELYSINKKLPHILDDIYTQLDATETNEDLEALFDVLNSVKDSQGNPAILTANTIMANPDFARIAKTDFSEYYYQEFSKEWQNDPKRSRVMNMFHEGIEKKLLFPQLHGREHLQINQWLSALRNGHKELREAFDYGLFGINVKEAIGKRNNVMAALDYNDGAELNIQSQIISEAQATFIKYFGFASSTFISPSYIWHEEIEAILKNNSIKAMQGLSYQYSPSSNNNWYDKKYRYTGKVSNGISHLVRNAFFEPSLGQKDVVSDCLQRVDLAFKMKKPAIIGSHRINFMGSLDENNRKNSLIMFKDLLKKLVKRWPNVEFMSSDELAECM